MAESDESKENRCSAEKSPNRLIFGGAGAAGGAIAASAAATAFALTGLALSFVAEAAGGAYAGQKQGEASDKCAKEEKTD